MLDGDMGEFGELLGTIGPLFDADVPAPVLPGQEAIRIKGRHFP